MLLNDTHRFKTTTWIPNRAALFSVYCLILHTEMAKTSAFYESLYLGSNIFHNSNLIEWGGTGIGCPGKRWSHWSSWRFQRTMWIWHMGTWFSRYGGDGLMVGLDNLRGLLQPLWFCDSAIQSDLPLRYCNNPHLPCRGGEGPQAAHLVFLYNQRITISSVS